MNELFAVAISCDGISVSVIATLEDTAARGACMVGTREFIEAQQGCKGVIPHRLDGDLQACFEECKGKKAGYEARRPLPVVEEGVLGPSSVPRDHPSAMPIPQRMCGNPWLGSNALQEGF